MKKLQSLGNHLSKQQQKNIAGGLADPGGGGGGACYWVYSTQGYSSCWFITGHPLDLCHRVYGDNCEATMGPVDCQANNCTMN